jgi:hypothetical protein
VNIGRRTEEIGAATAEHFAVGLKFNMNFHADDDFVGGHEFAHRL